MPQPPLHPSCFSNDTEYNTSMSEIIQPKADIILPPITLEEISLATDITSDSCGKRLSTLGGEFQQMTLTGNRQLNRFIRNVPDTGPEFVLGSAVGFGTVRKSLARQNTQVPEVPQNILLDINYDMYQTDKNPFKYCLDFLIELDRSRPEYIEILRNTSSILRQAEKTEGEIAEFSYGFALTLDALERALYENRI